MSEANVKNVFVEPSIWRSWPFRIGIAATIFVMFFGFWFLAFLPLCPNNGPCHSNWRYLLTKASPNEIGDMLAGLAGSLAFVWIVVTVLLQKEELGEQRKELHEQRIATQEMARAMAEQAKVFEDEQKQRKEEQTERVLDELLAGIVDDISIIPLSEISWQPSRRVPASSNSVVFFEAPKYLFWNTDRSRVQQMPDILKETHEREVYLKKQSFHVLEFLGEILFYLQNGELSRLPFEDFPETPIELRHLKTKLNRVIELEDHLSSAQTERIRNLRVNDLSNALETLLGFDDLWKRTGT